MPIYEYRCEACAEEFQAIRRITDDSRPPCKACGSDQVVKKISLSAFHLKGTGWYKTDYADKTKAPKDGGADMKPTPKKDASASDSPKDSSKEPSTSTSDSSAKASTAA